MTRRDMLRFQRSSRFISRLPRRAVLAVAVLAGTVSFLGGAPLARQEPMPSGSASSGATFSPSATSAQASETVDAATRKDVAEALATALADNYASAGLGHKMADLIRYKLATGAYDNITSPQEVASALTRDIRSVVDDQHLNVRFRGQGQPMIMGPGRAPSSAGPHGPSPMGMMMGPPNGGIGQTKILEGNVGYLVVIAEPAVAGAKEAIAAAFAALQNTAALIIDARNNHGGDPETVAFYMSYLSSGAPYVINRVHWRKGNVEEFKTTDMGGLSYGAKKPVYYLTSKVTRSAGEEFAYDLQAFKRAVIVGGVTGGAGNPGDFVELGHGFSVFVPEGYVHNAVTGGNWEGVGVKPDVDVPPNQALIVAERMAVDRLLARATDKNKKAELKALASKLKDPSTEGLTSTDIALENKKTP
jgi:Peptidase family S41/N-terminal domain of Peptidase_S41 in eukaryotic IRBP